MKHLGIEVPVKNVPELDPGFLPLGKFCTAFLKDAKKPLDIAVERAGGEVAVYKTFIHGTPDMAEADIYYVDRHHQDAALDEGWLQGVPQRRSGRI